jgi:parallel beta-helix repeat protein
MFGRQSHIFLVFCAGALCLLASFGKKAVGQSVAMTEVKLSGPLRITTSTRIAPGSYQVSVPPGQAVIEIAADHVTLDLTGVTIASGIADPWKREGIGVHSNGYSHITIRGGAIHGFQYGIFIQGADDGVKIEGTDVSENRAQKLLSTDTHYDEGDWVDIFHLDAWESYGAGLYLKDVQNAWVESVNAHNEQNGILLANATHSTVIHCDASHNSGWGIGLFHSSWNDVLINHADWDVRCESATYSHGCDSAGVLLMDGSNHNRIVGNSFTHSGDGYFLSLPKTGETSDYNYVAFNDGSYSPHNSFESTFTTGDQFYHNTADHSDYGFWLGFSHNTTLTDNHVEGSKRDGIAIEHGTGNVFVRNRILNNGQVGLRLFRRQAVQDPSRGYTILQNWIAGNPTGVLVNATDDVMVTSNLFNENGTAIRVEKGSKQVLLNANEFSPKGSKTVEEDSQSSAEVH